MSLLDAALAFHEAGLAVIPTRTDGSKAPAVNWKDYQDGMPDEVALRRWFTGTAYEGLGLITGAVSGHLEMLEAEGRAVHLVPELGRLMGDNGYGDLWVRLCAGYLEMTPSGGMHWHYRVSDGPAAPNLKLARRPATEEELAENPRDKVKVLIETRGEGGFTVTAPSGGRTHPSGASWTVLRGTPADIPAITVDERDALHAIARMLDTMPAYDAPPRPLNPVGPTGQVETSGRPGDDFNERADWDDILLPHGWQRVKKMGPGYGWTRPGKDPRDGISATTGTAADGVDRLFVFSSATEFDTETPYTKFAAWALLNHGGDYAEAARQLRRDGYGSTDISTTGGLTLTIDPNMPSDGPGLIGDWSSFVNSSVGATNTETRGEDEDCEGAALPATWAPVDLTNILDGTWVPEKPALFPRADGQYLLYAGRVHSFHGESESGKSLVAQSEAARVLADGGTVAYLDFESDAAAVTGRLLELGATPEQLSTAFEYRRPDTDPRRYPADRDHYTEFISRPWTYIVLDGMTDALGVFGYGTQDNDEITAFMRFLRRITTTTGAALVIVDHVTKDAESRGRFALGGQAKMNALDGAAYTIEVKEALGRGLRGLVVARVAKDRPGGIRPHCGAFAKDRTQEAARIWVDSTAGDGIKIEVGAPEGHVGDEKKPFRPTLVMERLSLHLEAAGDCGLNELRAAVSGRASLIDTALALLVEEGYVTRYEGQRRKQLHHLERPFRDGEKLTIDRPRPTVSHYVPDTVNNDRVPRVPIPYVVGIGRDAVSGSDEGENLTTASVAVEPVEDVACTRCFRPVPSNILAALSGVCSKCRAEAGEI